MPQPAKSTDEPLWYAKGLKFTCSGCGDCCTGAPGYVWVNKAEIKAMAAEVELEVDEFESRYVRMVGVRKSLTEFDNGDCVFFDNQSRKCNVYSTRPRQCRTWPFWDSNLRDPEAWEATCQECPGSGSGKLHDIGEIEKQRAVIRV